MNTKIRFILITFWYIENCQLDTFININQGVGQIFSQHESLVRNSIRCLRLSGGSDGQSLPATFRDVSECFYSILGLSTRHATPEEIKSAYRKKALRWHPDKNRNSPGYAEQHFKEIQRAYLVLTNHKDRAYYDQNRDCILAAGQRAAKLRAETAWFMRENSIKRPRHELRQDKTRPPASAFDILMRRKKAAACPPEPHRTTSGPSAFDRLMRRTSTKVGSGGHTQAKYS
jgi:curved DNA-binding protein CbpA